MSRKNLKVKRKKDKIRNILIKSKYVGKLLLTGCFIIRRSCLVVAWVEDFNIRQSGMQRSVYLMKPSAADGEMTDVARITDVETGIYIYTFLSSVRNFETFSWYCVVINSFKSLSLVCREI